MKIADNIIKHHLRNVRFICGNACAGKTTMSRMLAEKHGLELYDFDAYYEEHRRIADEVHQPVTCQHGADFHTQWTEPIEKRARRNINSLREQTEMALIDLMMLSQDRIVVADVLFSQDYTRELLDYHQFLFLVVDPSMIRESYFHRPEKRGFYEYVRSQELADVYFENIFAGLELTNEMERRMMADSGFYMLERTREKSMEEMLYAIEEHFGL